MKSVDKKWRRERDCCAYGLPFGAVAMRQPRFASSRRTGVLHPSFLKGRLHVFQHVAFRMAEREGFEPPEACASPVFKTGTLNHSDISPKFVLSCHALPVFRVIPEGETRPRFPLCGITWQDRYLKPLRHLSVWKNAECINYG